MKRKISADYIVDFLMNEFVNQKVKPGERITENEIAKKMGVSQTDVREAISILVSKGFLERIPFKNTIFKSFSIKELIDYQKVRARLEVMSIETAQYELFCKNIDLEYLKKTINNMLICSKDNNYKGRTYYDIKFHKHIVKAAENKSLLTAWDSLGHYYWAYVWLYLDVGTLYLRTIKHQDILNALETKDKNKLIILIKKHFSDLEILLSRKEKDAIQVSSEFLDFST